MRCHTKGFSLIELLTTLSITAVLASMAIPSSQHLIESNRAKVAREAVLDAFYAARLDAVKNHQPVIVCGSSDAQQCDHGWNDYLLVFRDPGRNEQLDDDDILISMRHPVKTGNRMWSSSNRRYYRVRPNGALASMPGSIRYCSSDADGDHAWRVVINRVGRVRWTRQEPDGGSIDCSQG